MAVLIVTCVAFANGCSSLPFLGSTLSYEEADAKLRKLVDGALQAGLDGGEISEEPTVWDEICTDSNLAPTGRIYPTYTYHFPLEQLGPHRKDFVERVADYWDAQGLRLDPDNAMEGIIAMFATSSEGFAFEAFENDRTGMALVTGSGPCVERGGRPLIPATDETAEETD